MALEPMNTTSFIQSIPGGNGPGIDLSLAEPPAVELSPELYQGVLNREKSTRYYPPVGDAELKEVIWDRFYKGSLFEDVASDIVLTHGAIHGIDSLFRAYLSKGDEVLIPDPGFPPYESLVELSGGIVKKYELFWDEGGRLHLDLESIASQITEKTKFILLNSPHNPTGHVLQTSDFHGLCGLLEANPGLRYISDEVYSNFCFDAPFRSFSEFSTQGFVVSSASKTLGLPGFRVGWVLGKQSALMPLLPIMRNAVGSISSIGTELVKLALGSGASLTEALGESRTIALEILKKNGIACIHPQGALFILIKIEDKKAKDLLEYLAGQGIKVVPGAAFSPRLEDYLRVAFSKYPLQVKDEFEKLVQSIQSYNQTREKIYETC